MKLVVLGSGSKENGYVLKAENGETLVIEAGCHISKLEKAMDFDFTGIVGCIISHRHMDHAFHVGKYVAAGINCYMNEDTIVDKKLDSHLVHQMESTKQFTLGNFKIKPLEVAHDVPCYAFLIDHPESGRTFFITDSSYCKWNLSKVKIQNWLVECNYLLEKVERNFEAGYLPKNVRDRVLTGHFGLHNCIDFFKANDLSETIRIVLLHLSDKNGDSKRFTKEIQGLTGKETLIAKAGLVIEDFGPEPF